MREVLTSRQRVLNAIGHKPLDRYPIDLSVHFSTGISAFAYRDLREYLGLDTDHIEMADCVQLLARVDVIAMTDIFKQNGGFVFNQVHNILGNVAPQNIVAMLDAAYENSWYGSDE